MLIIRYLLLQHSLIQSSRSGVLVRVLKKILNQFEQKMHLIWLIYNYAFGVTIENQIISPG